MFENGRGVAQDNSQAVRWYRKAADQGNAFAQVDLDRLKMNAQATPYPVTVNVQATPDRPTKPQGWLGRLFS